MKTSVFGMRVAALAGSLAMMTIAASAQGTTTAPVAPPVAPKAVAPAVKAPAAPVAPKTAAPAKAAPIVCKGKDETACKSEATACNWIVPTKVEANGKVDKAYCRKVAGVAKKAADAKKATSDALAKAGTAAKAAVTPAPVTPTAPAAKK
jgi:hypothetical protein